MRYALSQSGLRPHQWFILLGAMLYAAIYLGVIEPRGIAAWFADQPEVSRAFSDPTHRRFIAAETFLYLSGDWRRMANMDHYAVDCDFAVLSVAPVTSAEETLRAPEVQAKRFRECWDVALDYVATLRKPVPAPGGAA